MEGGRILELVVFKLREGVSREQFLGTNDAVSTWIRQQPGFISHELMHDAAGDRWIEVAWWTTMEDALAAAEWAMTSDSCAPMFALIDMESSLMLHGVPAIAPVLRADERRGEAGRVTATSAATRESTGSA